MKNWEIIADNLSKAGWSWGCVSAIDREGRTLWIVDAHRDVGRRFVVHADEKLTAFLELQRAIPETATDFHSRNFAPHASNLRATSDWRWGGLMPGRPRPNLP